MQINTAAQQPTQSNTDTQSFSRHAGRGILADHTDPTEQRDIASQNDNTMKQRNHSTQQNASLTNSCPWARASSTNPNKPLPASSYVAGAYTSTTNTCLDMAHRVIFTQHLGRASIVNTNADHEGQCAGMARASGLKADDSQLTHPRTSPNLSLENQRYGGKCSAKMLDASILKATANGTNRECKVPSAALAHALERNGRSPSITPDAGATLNQCRVERSPCENPGAPAIYV